MIAAIRRPPRRGRATSQGRLCAVGGAAKLARHRPRYRGRRAGAKGSADCRPFGLVYLPDDPLPRLNSLPCQEIVKLGFRDLDQVAAAAYETVAIKKCVALYWQDDAMLFVA